MPERARRDARAPPAPRRRSSRARRARARRSLRRECDARLPTWDDCGLLRAGGAPLPRATARRRDRVARQPGGLCRRQSPPGFPRATLDGRTRGAQRGRLFPPAPLAVALVEWPSEPWLAIGDYEARGPLSKV